MNRMDPAFRRCTITVMDNISDPFIRFDGNGICNYYHQYSELEKAEVVTGEAGRNKLHALVEVIKSAGQGKKYDCVAGISGGLDSSYILLQAKKLGLNPLVVHFDNGWNSELAVANIHSAISRLGFDLHTLVVDWEEFRDLQLSYFKANVVDIEALTDHAIIGTLFKLASKIGIKYILSGSNIVTEGILPQYWIYNKADGMNIKAIHKAYGQIPLKTYPFFSTHMKRYYLNVKNITIVSFLDYMDYNKTRAKDELIRELGWRDYGGKHSESIFTRFYQGHILPVKFGIDKRKAHLSTLICSGQVSREEALEELSNPLYDVGQLRSDKDFVLKKLGFSVSEFEEYLKAPRREHTEFRHERGVWNDIPLFRPFRPFWTAYKRFKGR